MSFDPEHESKPQTARADLEQTQTVDPTANDADNDVPTGYWRSFRFLGSILAIILLANGLFIGYVMPVIEPQNRIEMIV
jgi:hypothetical protein